MNKKRQKIKGGKNPKVGKLTYTEALQAAGRLRPATLAIPGLATSGPPHPGSQVDPITQSKIAIITTTMMTLGRSPGDVPVAKFDKAIKYRQLGKQSLKWLETFGIPARRDFAPLAAENYILLFGDSSRLPVPQENINRFLSRLIHCLLIETQITIAKQYYHGLGLYGTVDSLSKFSKVIPPEILHQMEQDDFSHIDLNQLHGRIFLEYCAIMIRAQWDKLTRLSCLVLDLKWNWASISDGLKLLEEKTSNQDELQPWCRDHLKIFIEIARDRLAESGWLKKFRDPLLHDVGAHSAGVIPHKNSLETTSEMWDKVCDEHDWLREAMMSALIVFISIKTPVNDVNSTVKEQ